MNSKTLADVAEKIGVTKTTTKNITSWSLPDQGPRREYFDAPCANSCGSRVQAFQELDAPGQPCSYPECDGCSAKRQAAIDAQHEKSRAKWRRLFTTFVADPDEIKKFDKLPPAEQREAAQRAMMTPQDAPDFETEAEHRRVASSGTFDGPPAGTKMIVARDLR
ncbi:hypothetical protein HUX53_15690 [Actinomadura sp. BRA 177]|nr:hypothetical protein [Actinomadura sp. BRA 177]